MNDSLRDRIAAVLYERHYRLDGRPSDLMFNDLEPEIQRAYLADADAVIEALPELNPDYVRAKYLKDWEEGYDEGYSAGGGGC